MNLYLVVIHIFSYKDKHRKHRGTNFRGNNAKGERMSGVVNQRVNECPPPAKFTGERMSV